MATSKKYYWIKLKDSLMTGDAFDFLMSKDNGSDYVVIYLLLCLKTVNTSGKLEGKVGEVIVPFTPAKVQRDLKYFHIDTILVAFELYKSLGLIYKDNDGTLQITDYEGLVGYETGKAELMRKLRKKRAESGNKTVTLLPKSSNNVTEENRDKSIDIFISKDINNTGSNQDLSRECINSEYVKKSFDEFFILYPRKHGKSEAYKAYFKLFSKLRTEQEIITLASNILAGLKIMVNECNRTKTETKYIKLPSNWLYEERWLDQYEPAGVAASDVPINPLTGEPYDKFDCAMPTPHELEHCSYPQPLADYIKNTYGVTVKITGGE
ncbi:MAG: phage replisome organizer N-terminal domain-containing protein [Firmicutes bacterium]|nr:phage replisome organizer N-terminal domain-containing protein [Bacillota bacterium]